MKVLARLALLYLGVVSFAAGLAWTVTTYSARLGAAALSLSLALSSLGACFGVRVAARLAAAAVTVFETLFPRPARTVLPCTDTPAHCSRNAVALRHTNLQTA
jgi:hypothetical protein